MAGPADHGSGEAVAPARKRGGALRRAAGTVCEMLERRQLSSALPSSAASALEAWKGQIKVVSLSVPFKARFEG